MWQSGVIIMLQQICGAGSDNFPYTHTHRHAHDISAPKHFRVNR